MDYLRDTYIEYCTRSLYNRSSIEREEAHAAKFFDQQMADHDETLTNELLHKVQTILTEATVAGKPLTAGEIADLLSPLYIT